MEELTFFRTEGPTSFRPEGLMLFRTEGPTSFRPEGLMLFRFCLSLDAQKGVIMRARSLYLVPFIVSRLSK